ncbi:cytochrome P450 [Phytomonospora endophytica]|uniref:Cytochrome P450 n=1 Tax=Phytomonospora endophytica TaxID=714109 RepID=A0A841FUQ3_9ACTN|nr:cytochrome P450 [Phytomonospora endophytica]MBB6037282.1 cytochrome P450 [Phytomonospora endophytica]GIG69974.1 cytochrome P450 [Phytomonospora endophytica]
MTQAPSAPRLPVERTNPFDPPSRIGELRETEPISRLAFPDGHVGWLVTSYALIRRILADQRFSSRQELRHFPLEHPMAREPQPPAAPGMFIRMDGEDHSHYRRLLTGQFTVRRMKALEPRVQEFIDGCLDALEAAGPGADLVEHFALPIPSLVICELLGVPYAERGRFQQNSKLLMRLDSGGADVWAAVAAMREFLGELVTAKKAEPTDDILGGLCATGELSDEELVNMGFLLLVAGHETTANMLGLGTFALLTHPEELAKFKADPGLVDGAVEELLRWLSIIQYGATRAALEDVDLDGVRISEGECLVLSVQGANRDPERFADADSLDVSRSAQGHLSFGHGVHQCLGQQLARVEMRLGYSSLFRRFPGLRLAVPPAEVPTRTDMVIYGVHELPVEW